MGNIIHNGNFNFWQRPPVDPTYAGLKSLVKDGWDLKNILLSNAMQVVSTPANIVEDMYNRAVQELWEEQKLLKTSIGKLIYV